MHAVPVAVSVVLVVVVAVLFVVVGATSEPLIDLLPPEMANRMGNF